MTLTSSLSHVVWSHWRVSLQDLDAELQELRQVQQLTQQRASELSKEVQTLAV